MDYDDLIRKRRALARDYFLNVPESWIDLNRTGYYANVWKNNGLQNPCGAVACLGGWLCTMPEIQEWVRQRAFGASCPSFCDVAEFLGVRRWQVHAGDGLFSGRAHLDIPQKQEALDRLDKLQTLPIIRYKEAR